MSETYLVTGGAGFIGSHIVDALVAQGAAVRVIDNFSTGKHENLAESLSHITLIEGDITDPDAVRRAVAGVDYVIHQAALPSVSRSVVDPLSSNDANTNGTLNVLLAARDAGVKRVVYAASSSAYGNITAEYKVETMPPDPLSPYAVAKLAGEYYCRVFYLVYGLETVALRYFNVFGPRQDPASQYAAVIPLFITKMLGGEPPTIDGDGLQTRDFTYIDNVAQANLLACRAPGIAGELFNSACGGQHSVLGLVEIINKALGTDIKPVFGPPRVGDVRDSRADISKAERMMNYKPAVEFAEGMARTVAWYREQAG
ncbi:MAG: SDR family oxidoreductase [Anaerolineae bacterium]|nr:SDR family oxidoreductase [Anaerolineae bacterium]